MAEGKDFWHDVRVGVTKELIVKGVTYALGLPVVLALVAAAAKPVRDWLLADSHLMVGGVVLLVWVLLIALTALARLAYTSAKGTPQVAPQREPAVPAVFNPTGVQLAAMALLLKRYNETTSLAQLHDHLKPLTEKAGGMPFLARQMEVLGRAHVVRIDETGRTDRNYSLTTQGRDWYLDQIKDAHEHPEGRPEAAPQVTPQEPHQATPQATPAAGDFEPNRVQLIAAKVLIDRYPKKFQLPDLADAMAHFAGGALPAPVAPQGEIARQLEDMHQRGIVTIDDPESQMAYYGLTRHGRDFMLEKWKASARPPARDPRSPSR